MALALPVRRKSKLSGHRTVREEVEKWVWPRPLTFEEFVDLFEGRDEIVELIKGEVIVEMGAQLDHEMLVGWLLVILRQFAEETGAGIVLGSRTPVKINQFNGRLPDLLFVRKERMEIVQQKAIFGAMDLAIEVRSPSSRKSSIIGLETDYRTLGVSEIVLIDPIARKVRVLRKRGDDYDEDEITEGSLTFETLPGVELELDWLFSVSRPTTKTVVNRLLESRKQ